MQEKNDLDYPVFQMGTPAAKLLRNRIADPESPARRVALHPELIVRRSCGPTA